jgi:hypothetical protein
MQGTSTPFVAPFMNVTPIPIPYQEDTLVGVQSPAHNSFGIEGKLSFQPEESDWIFSAGIRYGRAHTKRHTHHQTARPPVNWTAFGYAYSKYFGDQALADTRLLNNESHAVLDFQAGRDVGLGVFGSNSTSVVSAGVRFAQFSTKSAISIIGRPSIGYQLAPLFGPIKVPVATFYQYTLHANAERSFRGIGPSVSWNASAALAKGEHSSLTFDWGINAALMFGRQKAKTEHSTAAYYLTGHVFNPQAYVHPYPTRFNHSTRSRSVAVPNIGGFAGFSVKYPNVKVSLGYRADFFFGAVDTGIDTRQKKDLGFFGPFANISIGLGG